MSERSDSARLMRRTRPLGRPRLRQIDWLPYALIAPALLVMALITIYPAFYAGRISLLDLNLLRVAQATWVGIANYLQLLEDDIFRSSVVRTLRWTISIVAIQMALALPTALFLNLKFRWRGLARSLILIPYVIPTAVISVIWVYMFDANFGAMNEILVRLGVIPSYLSWISDRNLSFLILVLAMVWSGMPLMAIVLLAALQTFPEDLYEAARIDGAGAWQRFLYVTLPQLSPTILLLLLLRTMWLSHHVDVIFLVTNGGPGVANYTMPVYSFMLASVEFRAGYASAVAVVLSLLLLFMAVAYTRKIEQTREYL